MQLQKHRISKSKTLISLLNLFILLSFVNAQGVMRNDEVEESKKLKKSIAVYTRRIRQIPISAFLLKQDLKKLVDKLSTKPRDKNISPRDEALVYRLYSASILMEIYNRNLYSIIKEAMPWLKKSLKRYPKFKDHTQFKDAKKFLKDLLSSKMDSIDLQIILTPIFRIAMVEATQEQVDRQVEMAIIQIKRTMERK